MKNLIVMCGCAGSGKSTWIKNNLYKFKGYTAVVSRDQIRFDLVKEDEPYFSKENEVFKKFITDIKYFLLDADNVIVDATHLNLASRTKLLRALGTSLKNVSVTALVIKVPITTALEQNKLRLGTRAYVPEDTILRMHKYFTMPSLEEGFDCIIIYEKGKYTFIEREG